MGYVNSAQVYQWSGVRAVLAGKSAVTTPQTPTPSSCQMSLSCPCLATHPNTMSVGKTEESNLRTTLFYVRVEIASWDRLSCQAP